MAADLTTYDKALKIDYAPGLEKQFNTRTILLNRIKRDSTSIEGREFVGAVEGRMTEGIGSRAGTSATLPTPGNVGIDNWTYGPKYHWGKIQVSQVIIEHTKKDSGAFTKAVSSETKGLANTMTLDINRQAHNDGSGVISRTGTTTGVNVVQLATTGGYRALGNLRLRVGMYIDILVRSTGVVVATNRKITAIDKANNTITIDGAAVTTDSTHGVYRAGNVSGTTSYEINGLRNIIDDSGAVGGLNPATAGQEYWAAPIIEGDTPGTPQTISEVRMQKAVDEVEKGLGNGTVNFLLTSTPVSRAYFNLLVGLKRTVNSLKYEGGWKGLDFSGMPLIVDIDCKPNTIWAIDESHLKWYELAKPQWMDGEGSILKYDGGTGYEAIYYWFAQLGTNARNALGALMDITEN